MKSKEIATRIKELRLQNGFSQEELAEQSGLSLRTVQRIESGGTEPSEDSLKRLAKVLGETKDTFGRTMKKNKGLLMMTNFSALSFILLPIFYIILPLTIWFSNRRTIINLDKTAKGILNFQITWSLALILWFLMIIFKIASMFEIDNFHRVIIGINMRIQEFGFLFLYLYNFVFIIINTFRIDNEKELLFFPSIPFFRIRKK